MSTFTFVLILGAAVLVSSAINQIVSGVATPLIQIGIGVLLAFAGLTTSNFQVDPELSGCSSSRLLSITRRANTDKVALWSNRAKVLSLAVGLVVVTILCIGFTLHTLEPTIPLAAAFALGAALGPTDAVAVASLSKRVSLKRRQSILLSGESLINDASGVVSFQFSIAALTTGTFSLISATGAFLVSFFGGIAFGLVLAALLAFLVSRVRDLGLEDTTFHVLLEVLTPFAVFLTAEHVGVSGHFAVVRWSFLLILQSRFGPIDRAHENRVIERVARAFVRAQRFGVRAFGNPTSARYDGHVGGKGHRQRRAAFPCAGDFRHRDWCAHVVVCGH